MKASELKQKHTVQGSTLKEVSSTIFINPNTILKHFFSRSMGSTSLPLCVSMTTADISPLQLPPCGHSKVASQFTRCHQAVTATSTGNMVLCPWNFPGKKTGVGYHFLLQEIYLTQGLNQHYLYLLHWQGDSLPL